MITTASSGYSKNIFPSAKQSSFLRKPAVISIFFTGVMTVVFTVIMPANNGIFARYLTVLIDSLHLTDIINL
jgi:hypothetical protein